MTALSTADIAQRLTSCHAQLHAIKARGDDRYATVKLFHIETLLARAGSLRPAAQSHLLDKITILLEQFQTGLQQERGEAERLLKDFGEFLPELDSLFQYCQYRQMQRVVASFQYQQQRRARYGEQLQALTQSLVEAVLPPASMGDESGLDDVMMSATEDLQLPLFANPASAPGHQELKSLRRYRQLAARQKTQSMVNKAIITQPESPGPLNPHMLAIKSLTSMRDLSPAYLNRFVAYIETVLWLEEHQAPVVTAANKSTAKSRRTNNPKK